MTGYCRLCNLRIEGPRFLLDDAERGEKALMATGGLMLQHLQRSHPEAFQQVLMVSVQLQSAICGYLLNPPPEVPGALDTGPDLALERKAMKDRLSLLLASDDPCKVSKVKPETL